jgi:hypothetical protein
LRRAERQTPPANNRFREQLQESFNTSFFVFRMLLDNRATRRKIGGALGVDISQLALPRILR